MPDRLVHNLAWDAADRAVADAVAARHATHGRPILVGLAGAQGSGKSTMAPRIAALLTEKGLGTAILALDDFYLTRKKRKALAETVHPLLATRGAPGTHDVSLLTGVIDALLAGKAARVPRFDKGSDDRTGVDTVSETVDVVLLEGWCIGARAQTDAALVEPVNALERDEDADETWRRWVNRRLATDYAALFDRIDLRILLRAPDFAVVERWRGEQEAHLGPLGMTCEQIARFVQHYERVTRAMLAKEPADLIVDLSPDRVPVAIR